MRHIACLAVIAALLSASAWTPAPTILVSGDVHPAIWRDASERGEALAWVFFRDKGVEDEGQAIRELEATYPPRAVARREKRRTLPGLFDARDLRVSAAYEADVRAIVERVRTRSRWVNAVSVVATGEQIERVARLPFVDRIQPVRRGTLHEPLIGGEHEGGSTDGNFYGLSEDQHVAINLPPVHQAGFTGEGVAIGVLDTGFRRTHEAFNHAGQVLDVIAEYDFINDDPNTAPEQGDDPEQHSHGTIILGVMGAYKPGTYVGAAYDASFILCKTEDITDEYQAEEDYYVAGLEFIEFHGGDVATSSLGYIDWYTQEDLDGMTAVTTIGVNVATGNGVHCCTAAGNRGHDQNPETSSLMAPGDAFEVFTVGAANIFGEEAGFSSDGPTADGRLKPELLAIGDAAVSVSAWDDTSYIDASGTSMATPHLAGAVACLAEAGPQWSVTEMRDALCLTGTDYVQNGHPDPFFVRGYGFTDAFAALQAGPSPTADLTLVTMVKGTIISGGLDQMRTSDDAVLRTRSGFGSTVVDLHQMMLVVSAVAGADAPTTLRVSVESRLNQPSGSARLRLRDRATGQFVTVGSYAIGSTDAVFTTSDLDATRFVGSAGEIDLEIRHLVFVPTFAFLFESFIDHVEIEVE